MAFLGGTIQVVMAIALVIILCVVAFLVYNAEMLKAIRESGKVRREVPIFTGVKDLGISKDEVYTTLDVNDPMYRNIENSVNQKAGAEYTYNFWLYLKSGLSTGTNDQARDEITTDAGLTKNDTKTVLSDHNKPYVLLLRGDKKAVPFKSLCAEANDANMKVDVLVKQPMIKLSRKYDVLSVELNTQTSPEGVKEKSRNTCKNFGSQVSWDTLNSYRIGVKNVADKLKGKWSMITVVVQDTFPSDPLPIRNKVRVRIYINGSLEVDRYVDGKLAETSSNATLLRPNSGKLYIAPRISANLGGTSPTTLTTEISGANNVLMANLTYFNYAVDNVQIKSLFDAQFPKKYAITVDQANRSSLVPEPLRTNVADVYDTSNFSQI